METFLILLFDKAPGWFINASALVILIAMLVISFNFIKGTRRFVNSLGAESKLLDLTAQVFELRQEKEKHRNTSLQLLTVIKNSKLFINPITNKNQIDENLIQRIIESLAADIKTKSGSNHRCGLWVPADNRQVLYLLQGSSGFPNHYIGKRELDIDNSIAGRCFRKRETINCEDVYADADFKHNSDHSYNSLICVPISDFGVLTIDGKEPFDESAVSIAELYGVIIELAIKYLVELISLSSQEAAATKEVNN